ncbi:MAG: hypothetical protein ACOY0T_40385 [Myxococcota bacterium]
MTSQAGDRNRFRKLGGAVVVVVGVLVVTQWFKGSVPREHVVVFRLPGGAASSDGATRLTASFTPVGEAEASHGLSVALANPPPREVREKINLPDGDYIVLLELTYGANSGPSAPTKSETSRARRVTLTADETLVVFEAEGSE